MDIFWSSEFGLKYQLSFRDSLFDKCLQTPSSLKAITPLLVVVLVGAIHEECILCGAITQSGVRIVGCSPSLFLAVRLEAYFKKHSNCERK